MQPTRSSLKTTLLGMFASPLKSFLIIATLFGAVTIILAPPFTGADEEAHFVRAYGITQGKLLLGNTSSVYMPQEYRETLGCLQSKQNTPGQIYTYIYSEYGQQKRATIECIDSIERNQNATEAIPSTAASYSPTTYVPQVLVIAFARLIDLPIVLMSYGVRFAVLAVYILLIAIAIKLLPTRKWALVGLALLPHSILQVINPGADYMLLGSTAVFIAAIMKSMYSSTKKDNLDKKLLVFTLVAGALMVLPKGIFPGICFLPLLMFFGGLKNYLPIKMVSLVLICVVGLAWQYLALSVAIKPSGTGAVNSIIDFPYAFFKTMFYEWANTDFIYNYLGLGFGNSVGMPSVMITMINILFALYLFVDYSKDRFVQKITSIEKKALIGTSILVVIGVVIGSFAALYIAGSYLQDGSDIIKGVQARYFYPAFLLVAVIPVSRFLTASQRFYVTSVWVGSILVLSTQVIAIAVRYW